MRRAVSASAMLAFGLLAGFFLVFNVLFSDGPADPLHPEYLLAYGLILVAYGAAGHVGARWGGWRWWSLAWLCAPAGLILVLYAEPSWLLRAGLAALVAGGAALGVRTAPQPAP